MKQKDKELLLQDLCSRLPYGVKCSFGVDDAIYIIEGINPNCCGASEIQATHIKSGINGDFKINSCKPYLFPLSSMTEEQKREFDISMDMGYASAYNAEVNCANRMIDFFNKNHLDYRGLIPMGLVKDATGLNIY